MPAMRTAIVAATAAAGALFATSPADPAAASPPLALAAATLSPAAVRTTATQRALGKITSATARSYTPAIHATR